MLLDIKSEKGLGSSLPEHTVAPGLAAKSSLSWRSIALAAAGIALLTLQSSVVKQFTARSTSNSIVSFFAQSLALGVADLLLPDLMECMPRRLGDRVRLPNRADG